MIALLMCVLLLLTTALNLDLYSTLESSVFTLSKVLLCRYWLVHIYRRQHWDFGAFTIDFLDHSMDFVLAPFTQPQHFVLDAFEFGQHSQLDEVL